MAQAVGVDGLGDGGFAARADREAVHPAGGFLFGAGAGLDLLERLGQHRQVTSFAAGVTGAGEPVGASTAVGSWEQHGHCRVPSLVVGFHGGVTTPLGQVTAQVSQSMAKSALVNQRPASTIDHTDYGRSYEDLRLCSGLWPCERGQQDLML